MKRDASEPSSESMRLDTWLDVACLFLTRSQAKAACDGGKVDVNGLRAKAHREIRAGDRLVVTRAEGVRREVLVKGLSDRSIPKSAARGLYEDVTPPVPPEVAEARRLDRLLAPKGAAGRPEKRERRLRRRLKGM
jgi:ribosome-associated heat shock protein Hsp15